MTNPTRSDSSLLRHFEKLPSEEELRQELCRRILQPQPSEKAIKRAQWFLELKQRYDRGEFA